MSFNNLTPAQAERLAVLAEECGELVQAIGKTLRHGYPSTNPLIPDSPTNTTRVEIEAGDVLAALVLLVEAGDLSETNINAGKGAKLQRIGKWLHHARQGI